MEVDDKEDFDFYKRRRQEVIMKFKGKIGLRESRSNKLSSLIWCERVTDVIRGPLTRC